VESAAPSQLESEIEAGPVATNIEKIAKNPAVEVDGAHTGLSEGQGAGLPAGWIDDPIDQAEARRQFNRAMRDSESLSEELKEEVIQLLQAMNLPYLVAPFEAEAQCAVLEQVRSVRIVFYWPFLSSWRCFALLY
jgi:5'-3' exonuclease